MAYQSIILHFTITTHIIHIYAAVDSTNTWPSSDLCCDQNLLVSLNYLCNIAQ